MVLGEAASVACDFARVHVGAAEIAMREARRARTPIAQAKAWERVALQLRKAGRELAKGELAAIERARTAVLEGVAPAKARARG